MNQPFMEHFSEVLADPEKHHAELEAYLEMKRPAEELLRRQREALDAKFGPEKRPRPRRA